MRWSRISQPEELAYEVIEQKLPTLAPSALYETAGWRALVDAAGAQCLRCEVGGVQLVAAFVVPLRLGGRPTLANIQPLCEACALATRQSGEDYRRWERAA